MSSFRECCTAKSHLQANDRSPTLCTAAMRPLVALSAFLDVSSLNLAVSQGTAIFLLRVIAQQLHGEASKHGRVDEPVEADRVRGQPYTSSSAAVIGRRMIRT